MMNPFADDRVKSVPESEQYISFVRSSGPGGQNVNKTATKVRLRWNVDASKSFTDEEKQSIKSHAAGRLTTTGEIILVSDQFRSQRQNRTFVMNQLQQLIDEALAPHISRIPTRPTRASRRARQETKTRKSQKKQLRKHVEL